MKLGSCGVECELRKALFTPQQAQNYGFSHISGSAGHSVTIELFMALFRGNFVILKHKISRMSKCNDHHKKNRVSPLSKV